MSSPDQPAVLSDTQSSRTLLVTFLGSVVRPMGNWMPIGGTVELMSQCGLDAPSIRTAVFRLKKRGWLASEARAGQRGYALAPAALTALASGDEVIWHARQAADLADGWCIVSFSVPESISVRRHQLRAHLSALGFGNVSTAVWIAPARMMPAAERAIAELDLTSYCAIFVGDYVAGQDLGTVLARSWELDAIDRRYREFIDQFDDQVSAPGSPAVLDPQLAFVAYLHLVDRWRRLPFRDPGLPRELLPAGWSAPEAVALFERQVDLLGVRALEHAARHWPPGQALTANPLP